MTVRGLVATVRRELAGDSSVSVSDAEILRQLGDAAEEMLEIERARIDDAYEHAVFPLSAWDAELVGRTMASIRASAAQ